MFKKRIWKPLLIGFWLGDQPGRPGGAYEFY
jgi:hypothetical protein